MSIIIAIDDYNDMILSERRPYNLRITCSRFFKVFKLFETPNVSFESSLIVENFVTRISAEEHMSFNCQQTRKTFLELMRLQRNKNKVCYEGIFLLIMVFLNCFVVFVALVNSLEC